MNLRRAALIGALSVLFAGAASAQSRDAYMCYAAKSPKGVCVAGTLPGKICLDDVDCPSGGVDSCAKPGKPPKGVYARLDDNRTTSVGEDKTFEIKKPKHFCVPVDLNGDEALQGDGITDTATHYVSYQIKAVKASCNNTGLPCSDVDTSSDCPMGTCVAIAKFDKEAAKNTGILVGDAVADLKVNAGKEVLLLAPASSCQGNDTTPCPNPEPTGEDHFKCYAIKGAKGYCSNPAATNWLEACGEDAECSTAPCTELPKFAKGLASTIDDAGTIIEADGRAFGTGKPAYLCKAVEKTLPPTGTPEPPANPAARMVCYKGKAASGQCAMTSPINEFGACKDGEDCGGGTCVEQAKFDKELAINQGYYGQDQFDGDGVSLTIDHHRFNLAKEDVLCVPACEFSPLSFRATSLSIAPTGHPGDGLDVDTNVSTCRPHPQAATPPNPGCSGGIDNSLGTLIGALGSFGLDLNQTLQDSIDDGDINILLNLDEFANGTRVITGHTGEPVGSLDPNDPTYCDIANPASKCDYKATCAGDIEIVLPVNIAGLPGSPADVTGGGPGTSFGLSIPALGTEINIEVRNVKVDADIVHTGGAISSATGTIAGAIIQRELKNNIASIPDGVCAGGSESGETCPPAACAGGGFCLDFMFTIAGLIDGIPRDIDTDGLKTCEGGTNAGETCTIDANCPDQSNPPVTACDQFDGISVGLVFGGIDANIAGVDD